MGSEDFVVMCVIIPMVLILGVIIALYPPEGSISYNEAVEAGVAEYYLDENNERQFRFIECKGE